MKTLSIIIAAALLTGCATTESITRGTPNLSRELVDKSIVKGETTKAQVRALLGEPQTTTSGDSPIAAETWTYTKTFMRDASEKGGLGHGVAYSLANPMSGGYDRIEVSVLMVMFDQRGVVTRHSFSTSASGAPR